MRTKYVVYILVCLAGTLLAHADVTVESVGMGTSRQQALNDALRLAVEQGVGVKIFSESVFRKFVALKDAVVTESFGLVTGYKVLEEKHTGREWRVRIRATVSKDLKARWTKLKILLEQQGRPSIMFCLKESLDGKPLNPPVAEFELVRKFKDLGFRVIDRQWSEKIRALQKQLYAQENLPSQVLAVASQMGADLIVLGVVEGRYEGSGKLVGDLGGVRHAFTLRTKIVRTDTSQVIGSLCKTYCVRQPAMAYSRASAARVGFAAVASERYLQPMVVDMLRFWIFERERGMALIVVITGIPFKLKARVEKVLAAMPDTIRAVRVEHYRNRRLQLAIRSHVSAEKLAERLERIPDLPLEVIALEKNRVELGLRK